MSDPERPELPETVPLTARIGARVFGRAVLTQSIPIRTPDDILQKFERHAPLIGHIVFAWSRLHARLFDLFVVLINTRDERIADAIWRSIPSDRQQRQMLRRAAMLALENYKRPDGVLTPSPWEDIKWLLDQADERSGVRNDVIHTDYDFDLVDGVYMVIPSKRSENRLRELLR